MKDARGHGSNPRNARAEKIAINRAVDQRHFPDRTTAQRAQLADLGATKNEERVPFGSASSAAQRALVSAKLGFGAHAAGINDIRGK